MKRVLTLATSGLFVTGLALMPLAASANQTVTGKDNKPAVTAPAGAVHGTVNGSGTGTVTNGTAAMAPAGAPVKKTDEHKVTSGTSSTSMPSTGTTTTTVAPKVPAKTGS